MTDQIAIDDSVDRLDIGLRGLNEFIQSLEPTGMLQKKLSEFMAECIERLEVARHENYRQNLKSHILNCMEKEGFTDSSVVANIEYCLTKKREFDKCLPKDDSDLPVLSYKEFKELDEAYLLGGMQDENFKPKGLAHAMADGNIRSNRFRSLLIGKGIKFEDLPQPAAHRKPWHRRLP